MAYEYYGWVALAVPDEEREVVDFERGYQEVKRLLRELAPGWGQEQWMPQAGDMPQVVWVKGYDAMDLMGLFDLLEGIGQVFGGAYGEVQAIDHGERGVRWWDAARVERFSIQRGRLLPANWSEESGT